MKNYRRPFVACLLALLLIVSQQTAFTHLLSHLNGGSEAAAQYLSDDIAADQHAEACATCVAFAGAGGNAPPSSRQEALVSLSVAGYCLPQATEAITRQVFACRARGPPSVSEA